MNLFSYDDPTWVKDFQEALRDLSGEQLLLPPPHRTESTCVVAVAAAEEPDISTLHGSALRTVILRGCTSARRRIPTFEKCTWKAGRSGKSHARPGSH